jgi:hypothetical protein
MCSLPEDDPQQGLTQAQEDGMAISGLRGVPEIRLGSHLCAFYRGPQEFLRMTASFVKAGLMANELCVWILPRPLTTRLATKELARQGLDSPAFQAIKQLRIMTAQDWYSKDTFTAEAALERLAALPSLVRQLGYARVRVVGGPGRFPSEPFRQAFMRYERELTGIISTQAAIGLCCYPSAQEFLTDMLDIMSTHPTALLHTHRAWVSI